MTKTQRVVAGLNKNKPFSTWGIPEQEMRYSQYAMGGVFGLIWRGKPLPYRRTSDEMGASSPHFKKTQLEIPYWRVGYGFSPDSKQFFIVTNNESASTWSIETTRDFFLRELPTISKPTPEVGNYSAYGAFLPDFGTGAHLFVRNNGQLIKVNNKAGSLRGTGTDNRAGNVVWIMVK